MKYFAITMLLLVSSLAFAAGNMTTDSIKIALTATDCDPDHAESLILSLIGKQIVIQDLADGRLIVIDSETADTLAVYPFPEMLLSLCFADNSSVYALTRKGVATFAGLDETVAWLQQKKAAEPVLLQKADLSRARFDYRLLVDKSGKTAVWNRSESLLQVFNPDGSFVDAFPCQNNPVLTGRDSFISSYFAHDSAARIVEIGFDRPVENGEQKEVDSLLVELKKSGEFHILTSDAAGRSFKGIMLSSAPENSALDEKIHEVATDEEDAVGNVDQNSVEIDAGIDDAISDEFIDPANPGQQLMYYCSVDDSGNVDRLMHFPDSSFSGKIIEKDGVVYRLVPEYESAKDSISLSGLQVVKYQVTKK
jgi:hypothetical protein